MVLHLTLGRRLGFPAYVLDPPTYHGVVGAVVQQLAAIAPLITVALISFNFAVVYQEFQRGVGARRRNASDPISFARRVRPRMLYNPVPGSSRFSSLRVSTCCLHRRKVSSLSRRASPSSGAGSI
jgi:hypothetical protein